MFEQFTERARQAVVYAQDEARGLKHNYLGTEHLLLGLLREQEGLASRVLESLGIAIDEVRGQVARIVGQGEDVTSDVIPFTPRAKKVLELALREALSLGHNFIGTEHVLLGIVRENSGVASRILLDFGADAEAVRARTAELRKAAGRREEDVATREFDVPFAVPDRLFPPPGRRRRRSPDRALFFHLGRARDAALALGSYDLARELLELEVRVRGDLKPETDDPAP